MLKMNVLAMKLKWMVMLTRISKGYWTLDFLNPHVFERGKKSSKARKTAKDVFDKLLKYPKDILQERYKWLTLDGQKVKI